MLRDSYPFLGPFRWGSLSFLNGFFRGFLSWLNGFLRESLSFLSLVSGIPILFAKGFFTGIPIIFKRHFKGIHILFQRLLKEIPVYDSFSLVLLQGFLRMDSFKAFFPYIGAPFKVPFWEPMRKPHILFKRRFRGDSYLL